MSNSEYLKQNVFYTAKMEILSRETKAGAKEKKKKKKKSRTLGSNERQKRREETKALGGNLLHSGVKTGFIPAEVSGLDAIKIREVNKSCISKFNMAIDIGGRVYSLGKNEAGQLGLGDLEDHETPQLIEELELVTT